MRARRTDANQAAIFTEARKVGLRVYDTSGVGRGFPDAVVQYGGATELWEIKNPQRPPSARKYTKAQSKVRFEGMSARLVMTVDDVLAAKNTMLADLDAIKKARLLT